MDLSFWDYDLKERPLPTPDGWSLLYFFIPRCDCSQIFPIILFGAGKNHHMGMRTNLD